jgi:polyisoprenyl-phosphate glycosyltransferase
MGTKVISIISPCFNEELNIGPCHAAVRSLFETRFPDYVREHIFADNASTDGTVATLRELAKSDPHVKVIVNARNYGPFRSTFNALLSSQGDAVVVMLAVDLQDPPELIEQFVRAWENGHEVVYGIRADRQEGFVMRVVRNVYYRLVSRFANIQVPVNVGEFQLIDRVVVEALRQCDDYYPYIRGLIANCGFRSTGISYTWRARARGMSKNRLYHLIDQALNGIISFTNIPMRSCLFLGLVISFLSIGYALATMIINFIHYRQLASPGIPTLITALFFFSGVQLLFLGVLGEYISAIHFQVRKRPLVVERERINFLESPSERRP